MGLLARASGRRSVAAAALALTLVSSGAAEAQSKKDLARARERFKEAAALQAAGDFARALEAYKDVALVKSSAQVRFNIATCEEKTGDYVRAVGSYRLALTEATRSSAKSIESSVQKALSDLEPRIPMLLVKRGEGAAVAEISLDGRPIANPSIGVEFQVNPGPHSLAATASDRLPFRQDINLSDGQHLKVDVVLKPRPVVVAVTPPAGPSHGEELPPPPPPPPSGNKSLRYAGFAVGGLGIVGLGVSAAFFAQRQSAISTLDAACGANRMSCPASLASTRDSGQRDATISTAMFATGLGLAAVGGVLIGLSTRKPKQPEAGLVVLPGGVALRGGF